MSDTPSTSSQPEATPETAALIQQLRRKEGNWVTWGKICQQLQKLGYSPQALFEETGFEPTHQNQVMVAAQVYTGLENAAAPAEVLTHFSLKGSDILYELRILAQTERVAAAEFAIARSLDLDEAHDLAKAIKDYTRLRKPPEDFSNHPGDALAYQCWVQARQKSDLQARSRLIAKGLRYVHSDLARSALEKLLTNFTVVKTQSAPVLPIYRLETEVELPRIIPLAGQLPLSAAKLLAVAPPQETGPFRIATGEPAAGWIPVPGWQVIFQAVDPVAVLCQSDRLPSSQSLEPEEVLLICDRAQQDWDRLNYFLVDQNGEVEIQWSPEPSNEPILGRLLIIVRPKRILDENVTKELWLVDE